MRQRARVISSEFREGSREEIVDAAREPLVELTHEASELRDRLIEELRPSAKQRALIDEGFALAPDVVASCHERARLGERPEGLFFHELAKAQASSWRTPDRRHAAAKPSAGGSIISTAWRWFDNVGVNYEPTEFEEELKEFSERGLDEPTASELRDHHRLHNESSYRRSHAA
jgi:hypothetical protein